MTVHVVDMAEVVGQKNRNKHILSFFGSVQILRTVSKYIQYCLETVRNIINCINISYSKFMR
jgi:hypothetical protein